MSLLAKIGKLLLLTSLLCSALCAPARPFLSADAAAQNQAFCKTISPHKAWELMGELAGDSGFMIIDLQTAPEYAARHINNATNIDFYSSDFDRTLLNLPRSFTYVIYCRKGVRGALALSGMHRAGFLHVYNIEGGINAWIDLNFPAVVN
jgi:rhodanese-related sulfurtransferase